MAGAVVQTALRILRPRTLAATSCRVLAPVQCVLPPASCVLSTLWRSCPVRTLQLCSALCAGHNKWSKVKHIKGPKDEARGKMITKFGMMIKIAVKEGGPNPDLNVNLAHVLEQCKSKNIPKASIEAAIKNAEKSKPASQHIFEARGPGGCLLLIEVLTDNHARSHQEIKRLIVRNKGMLSDGARNNFNKRGVVVVPGQNISTERALELAIEAGAEDVQETEDEEEQPILQFICDMTDVRKVRASLEELGMQIISAGLEFVPRTLLSLDQDQLDAASTLIEALNDFPEVVRVWDNIQADS
ncbi:translational activator of cytochrome c oxidase 1-like [Plectropomus leopardus]|uniref:translational activator of cytochrome c oxidase 1-like n=1 Tax=Plectropomus leopardus TaxID=160734 RepID=UPI001C4CDDC3|nr:translational activator of cytochrome c oxidase 1-like [Plectropomus leopardus]XP_042364211.1 translational activator of cytochrome c oxidase 1-like [Plectropomus leopardus]XP_042364212.1 translational activator of cytochrome c oxidase 1-like [Plectropomus leopardus]